MILDIVFAVIAAIVTHELGHCIAAVVMGKKPKFGMAKIGAFPRFTVKIESELTDTQRRVFGIAGFVAEALAGVAFIALIGTPGSVIEKPFAIAYCAILTAHLAAYPFYNKGSEANDFKNLW